MREILVFRKSYLLQTEEKGCLRTYGHASLVSDFKLIRENDDLLSSRHKHIFEGLHLVQEYTKMQIADKRYQTNTVHTFYGTWSTSALTYLSLNHFPRYRTKICEMQVRLWNNKFDKLVRLCICSNHPLPWWYFPVRMKRFWQWSLYVILYYE